jgi:hypothetical protein
MRTGRGGTLLALVLVCLGLLGARGARAEVAVEGLGSATVSGGDSEAARRRALDDALRQGVDQVIGTLITPETRKAHADTIKKRVLRRAKAYVVQHKVLDEGETGGVYQVHIEARVAEGQLRDDLVALGIPVIGGAPPPGGGGGSEPGPGTPAKVRPTLGVMVTAAEGDPGLAERTGKALSARGFTVVSVPGSEVPVDDATAVGKARAAGATVVLVLAVESRDGGGVRGTTLRGAEVAVAWRLVDGSGAAPERVAEGRGDGAAAAAKPEAARAQAAGSAAERVARAVGPALEQRWPRAEPAGDAGGGVIVRVTRVTRWADVAAAMKAMSGAPGAERVVVRAAGPAEVRLLVIGRAGAREVAGALAGGPPGRATVVGPGAVELELAPPAPATPLETP